MFKILYTGATTYQGMQQNASSSLGGFISNTTVPNNKEGNLFSTESYWGTVNEISEVRAIVLQAIADAANVDIGVMKKTGFGEDAILLGFTLIEDSQSVEKIMDGSSDPSFTEFNAPMYMQSTTDFNKMFQVVDFIPAGQSICIWIKRELVNDYEDNSDDPDCECDNCNNDETNIDMIPHEPVQFIVGDNQQYSPNQGDTQYINPTLKDLKYTINRNGVGVLFQGVHFLYLDDGGFELLNGDVFGLNEEWTLEFYL